MTDGLEVVLLTKAHDRAAFDCGEEPLNTFLKQNALQNMKAGFNATHVLVKKGSNNILGFYSISSQALTRSELPERERKKLPKYPVPTVLLSRLALDVSENGKGYGKRLLFDCMRRVALISFELGIYSLEVDAKNETAKSFYLQFGFTELEDNSLHLHLHIKTIRESLGL